MATNNQNILSVKVLFVVNIIGILAINGQWVIDDDGCRTPDKGVGTCIVIKQCQPIVNFVQQSTSLTQSTIETLRRYQCGYEGVQVKVCCPSTPIVIGNSGSHIINTIPATPDVTNHRNFNLLPSNCGLLSTRNRITGGNKTALFEFPWMTLISYQTSRGPDFRCGGSVINERYILTAAHCITNLVNLRLLGVRVGEYNISSTQDCDVENGVTIECTDPVQDIYIEDIIPHPMYNSTTFTDDIGLIRLQNPIRFSESVKAICLPTTNALRNYNYTNNRLLVTGWGATETGRKSPDLLKVEVPVIPQDECRRVYEQSPAKITYRQLCAGGRDRQDSCGGDSGGPLQTVNYFGDEVRYVQFGIVSFGPRFCGQEGYPGVYTRTDYYMDWILDNMRP